MWRRRGKDRNIGILRGPVEDGDSRRLWLGALLGCAVFHATLSLTVPTAAWTTPAGNGVFCLLAMALSLDQACRNDWGERWRWFAFATSFLLWTIGWAMLAYLDAVAKADFAFLQPDSIAAAAKYIPLLFLMAPENDIDTHRVFRVIDGAQGILSTVLITVLFFPLWFHLPGQAVPGTVDGEYRDALRNGVTALALITLFYKASAGQGKIAVLLAVLLACFSVTTPIGDYYIIPHLYAHKGSPALMIADIPLALFVLTILYLRTRPVPAFLRRWPFANEGLLLAPAGLTVFLLILSFLIGSRNALLGLWAGMATFALFAVRVGFLQRLYVRTQIELAKSERGRAEFLANISHDIRSPLTSIALTAATLSRIDPTARERTDLLRRVQAGCEHVISLLDDMLTFSHIGTGAIRLAAVPFDASQVIDQAIELLRPQATAARLTLRRTETFRSGNYQMRGDAVQLRRALANLLTNAVRFTPAGGVVTVSCIWMGPQDFRQLRITVTDTGVGIPHDQQAQLLGPLRETREPINGTAGSGLGLAIAKAIAEMMGGALGFESEPGRGSRFWIDVPDSRPTGMPP